MANSTLLMSDNQDAKNITVPIPVLASLVFGAFADKDIPNVPGAPLSRSPGDLATVLVRRYSIGAYIASVDDNEEYFHVELYPGEPGHSEIWLAAEWKQSNTRHVRVKAYSAAERQQSFERGELVIKITDELTALKRPEQWCQLVAYQIALNYKTQDLSGIIRLWHLEEIMAPYLEELKKGEQSLYEDTTDKPAA